MSVSISAVQYFYANVNVLASNAVSDGQDRYGYLIYVRSDLFDKTVKVLGLE